jgi:hypothetical protein
MIGNKGYDPHGHKLDVVGAPDREGYGVVASCFCRLVR